MDQTTLRALKGAPLSALVAMLMLRRSGPTEIAQWTGYDRKTCASALKILENIGYVQAFGRYDSYKLIDGATQLPLLIPSEMKIAPCVEGENLPLDVVVVGINTVVKEGLKPTTTTTGEGENLPLPAELVAVADEITQLITDATGYPFRLAKLPVIHALAAGDDPDLLRDDVLGWLAHARAQNGSIHNPGALVCARIRDGQAPPEGARRAVEIDRIGTSTGYSVPAGYEGLISS